MVSAEWLKRTELFEALEESQLNVLLLHASVESLPEGKTIFNQGDKAVHLYVLVEGAVVLTIKTEEKIDLMTSKVEKEGAAFGMPSLIEPFRYNVTAICSKPSKILVLDADYIKKTMEDDPKMGMKIMKKLASVYFNRLNDLRSGVSNLLKTFELKTP